MPRAVLYAATVVVLLHGLIHLMGFVAYWQIAELQNLPYKTTLLKGQLEVGKTGIRVFGVLWLVATVGFVAAAIGLVADQGWWRTVMLGSALFSLMIAVLDWNVAILGAIVDAVILAVLVVGPRIT
jgi:hypothetical protein